MINFREIDPTTLDYTEVYKLMVGAIVPRPIAWISTCSAAGAGNLAPFSYFNAVGSKPPTVMFSMVTPAGGELKDTHRNIIEVPEFTVHIVSESLLAPMIDSATNYPYGVDEMEKVGLTAAASKIIRPKRIAEAAICFECKVSHVIPIGDGTPGTCTMVLGEIVYMHVEESLFNEQGRIDPVRLKPVARLGGPDSVKLGEIVSRAIPKV